MKKNNSALSAFLCVLIVVASFVFTWKFILPDYTLKQQEITQTNQDISIAQAKYNSLNQTKTSLNQLGDLVNQMLVAVPSDKDTPNLISELEAVAAKNSMTIPSINIAAAPASGSTTTTTTTTLAGVPNSEKVSIAVCGSFASVHALISSLETDLRFMDVESVTLTQEAADSGSGGDSCADQTALSIQLKVYERTSASSASGG